MRKLYIDCGANVGAVLTELMDQFPDHEFHAFEPNPALLPLIHSRVRRHLPRAPRVYDAAVWLRDGATDLFLGHPDSSTLLPGKRVPLPYTQQIDYAHPVRVPCVDFSRWLARTASPGDEVRVKMDIEGAEYPVLERMVEEGTIRFVSQLQVEWHHDRFDHIPTERHERLVADLQRHTTVLPWH